MELTILGTISILWGTITMLIELVSWSIKKFKLKIKFKNLNYNYNFINNELQNNHKEIDNKYKQELKSYLLGAKIEITHRKEKLINEYNKYKHLSLSSIKFESITIIVGIILVSLSYYIYK